MAHVRPLFRSQLLAVDRVHHRIPGSPARRGEDDRSDRYGINFVDCGVFAIDLGKRRWTIGPDQIFVTVPGMEYRCCQLDVLEGRPPGVCLDVCFSDIAREEHACAALRSHVPAAPLTNRRAYLRRRLTAYLDAGRDTLAVESIAGELLQETLRSDRLRRRLSRPSQLDAYARRVDRAREILDTDCASEHSLVGLARTTGMSPYHFARTFTELVGVPPHRYLVRRRLAMAAARLREGASATETCYAVGFGDLSHFTHAFRRVFGTTPGRFARQGSRHGA